MPTKSEEEEMAKWLRANRILFEVSKNDYDRTIELKLIDYKHKCLIVSKRYPAKQIQNILSRVGLTELVKEFEQEMVYPILFNDVAIVGVRMGIPTIRLIREN